MTHATGVRRHRHKTTAITTYSLRSVSSIPSSTRKHKAADCSTTKHHSTEKLDHTGRVWGCLTLAYLWSAAQMPSCSNGSPETEWYIRYQITWSSVIAMSGAKGWCRTLTASLLRHVTSMPSDQLHPQIMHTRALHQWYRSTKRLTFLLFSRKSSSRNGFQAFLTVTSLDGGGWISTSS